jgi:hypothetical protein
MPPDIRGRLKWMVIPTLVLCCDKEILLNLSTKPLEFNTIECQLLSAVRRCRSSCSASFGFSTVWPISSSKIARNLPRMR